LLVDQYQAAENEASYSPNGAGVVAPGQLGQTTATVSQTFTRFEVTKTKTVCHATEILRIKNVRLSLGCIEARHSSSHENFLTTVQVFHHQAQ